VSLNVPHFEPTSSHTKTPSGRRPSYSSKKKKKKKNTHSGVDLKRGKLGSIARTKVSHISHMKVSHTLDLSSTRAKCGTEWGMFTIVYRSIGSKRS
jgi:hypothetical protein